MKKVAIFTEGQAELIFVREVLLRFFNPSKLSFKCTKLCAQSFIDVPYDYSCPEPEIHFLLINVQNDERVISAIKDREKGLIERGYEKIIGLRDMYSQAYDKRSHGVIDDNVSRQFIEAAESTIRAMQYSARIKLYFSIMEIEAWFLSMYNIFKRYDSGLSAENIKRKLSFDLRRIDPEKEFFRPSNEVKAVYSLIGLKYDKKSGDIERIARKMDCQDFLDALDGGRCKCFDLFCQEILSCS